jgi:LPXTG-motif cell wall-anchored protein
MIRKKLAVVALLSALAALVPVTSASAGGGPSDYVDCLITVDPSTFEAGDTVTVTGTGLEPNFETTIEFNSVTVQVGTAITDASGSFEVQVTIPADAVDGPHTISAVCDTAGNISSTDVTVSSISAPSTTTGGGPLPRTGTDSKPLLVVGAIAILVGIALVLVSKRRRRAAVDH